MASTSTINAWLDELALSFTGNGSATFRKHRRILDAFRRRVKHHNYARTNQFEVEERLTGLEEKLQIVNHDELSDELYQRRAELRVFHDKWLPDILDFLLKISGNPVGSKKLLDLYTIKQKPSTPPSLTWNDLQAGSPINTHDRLWKVPTFADSGSDEENWTVSTTNSSPESKKHITSIGADNRHAQKEAFLEPVRNRLDAQDLENSHSDTQDRFVGSVNEIQLVREVLFLLRGLPAPLLEDDAHDARSLTKLSVRGITETALQPFLDRARFIHRQSKIIENWIIEPTIDDFIQVLKHESEITLRSFYSVIDRMQNKLLNPQGKQPVSILKTIDEAERASQKLVSLSLFVCNANQSDSIACLEKLYESLLISQQSFRDEEYYLFSSMFCSAFEKYFGPVWLWAASGTLEQRQSRLFVKQNNVSQNPGTLWQNWYTTDPSRHNRPPEFLNDMVEMILTCGKTAAFLHHLSLSQHEASNYDVALQQIMERIRAMTQDPFNPFAPTFDEILQSCISNQLSVHTENLKRTLHTNGGFNRTLQAFHYVYLRKNGAAIDSVEAKIFDRIDRCIDSWNDRFLIVDMLEDLYISDDHPVDLDSIIVHSSYTSSRSMQSRRQSVKILNALAIEYALPWPMANIIPETSMQSYRRISLTLVQIRRTKYVLERAAYLRVQTVPVCEDATVSDQKFAQALVYRLLAFVNVLYDHFTTSVCEPMTNKMRHDLDTASTFDAMIHIHKSYIDSMEYACLASLKLKMLKETLISLLDLCIRCADLISNPEGVHKGDSDIEANSFTSAQSRRRRRRRRMVSEAGSSSEDDDDGDDDYDALGEGYSSFIVLDENTTVMKEIRKLLPQFTRQMEFFVAGLRGVARGTETMDEFEMLAERLARK